MKMFDLILAIFYFAVAGVEIFGAACAIRVSRRLDHRHK